MLAITCMLLTIFAPSTPARIAALTPDARLQSDTDQAKRDMETTNKSCKGWQAAASTVLQEYPTEEGWKKVQDLCTNYLETYQTFMRTLAANSDHDAVLKKLIESLRTNPQEASKTDLGKLMAGLETTKANFKRSLIELAKAKKSNYTQQIDSESGQEKIVALRSAASNWNKVAQKTPPAPDPKVLAQLEIGIKKAQRAHLAKPPPQDQLASTCVCLDRIKSWFNR